MGSEVVNTIDNNNGHTKKTNKTEEPDLNLNYDEGENICYQEFKLLWVDANVNNNENLYYQNMLKRINSIKLFTFTDINTFINKLIKIEFEKTMILVSGSLSSDLFNEIENNLDKILVFPKIMIFQVNLE